MTIAEKITQCRDKRRFTLYREGVFYKCYNEDAMVFSKRVRPYKVISKFVKSAGETVLSLGFPVSEIEKGKYPVNMLLQTLGAEKYEEGAETLTFYLKGNFKQDFDSWRTEKLGASSRHTEYKTAYHSKTNLINLAEVNEPYNPKLIAMIKDFDLANSTPMQGLYFIQQLKDIIQKVEGNNGNI